MPEQIPKDPQSFCQYVLSRALCNIKNHHFEDNFDGIRFQFDSPKLADDFQEERRAVYFRWFFTNAQYLFVAMQQLEDLTSQSLFIELILYRLCGHLSSRIHVEFDREGEAYEQFLALHTAGGSPSEQTLAGEQELIHYDVKYGGTRYVLEGIKNALEYPLFRRQYFYNRDGVCIEPSEGDYVVDGGACLGETTVVFSHSVGPTGRVYAFEPIQEHFNV